MRKQSAITSALTMLITIGALAIGGAPVAAGTAYNDADESVVRVFSHTKGGTRLVYRSERGRMPHLADNCSVGNGKRIGVSRCAKHGQRRFGLVAGDL